MEKESGTGSGTGLFVNDGSFMERFKQIQQQNEKEKGKGKGESTKSGVGGVNVSQTSASPKVVISRPNVEVKAIESRKIIPVASSGKLAFSLKQKSKLVAAPIKLGEDEDDYDNEDQRVNENTSRNVPSKRYKFGDHDASQSLRQVDVVPAVPSDPTVKNVADKLASFVAKNGREFENITRQKNPGDTPFKFLFDKSCSEYKYYEYCLNKEEKAVSQTQQQHLHGNVGTTITSHVKYQIPSSALYEAPAPVVVSSGSSSGSGSGSGGPASNDPIAMMEYYVKKAAAEERIRPPKASKGEMPPPASLQAPTSHGGKRGHHMGDYIPLEELEKFMATCNDKTSEKYAKALADKNKIQADNVGHKLLSKMGWKEGEGLGSSRKGIADPIMSGDVKKNHLGVGAHQPGEVVPEDDIYEQYKKRMMLGYRHRPNPLGNPRKSYY